MAKNKHIQGLDNLNSVLDSLVNPKFRKAALRNAAKRSMEPAKSIMEANAPALIKNDVVIKTKVNTDRVKSMKIKGFIKEDKYNELYSEVTFDMKKGKHGKESAFGMAMVFNYGRRNPLAKVKGDSKFFAFGNPTEEPYRYIGATEGNHFVDKVRFESEPIVEAIFTKVLLEEIEKQAKKQDKQKGKVR
ncbi:hypothetical protein ACYHQE_004373 [Aeromonas salmonicida]